MNVLNQGIYNKLAGTAITNLLANGSASIFSLLAKDNAAPPYIVYSIQGGGDENFDSNRTKNIVMFIRAYSQVSEAQAGSIDAQIDAAMHLQTLSVSGWSNFWTAREEDLTAVEILDNGTKIWMNGGFYRIRIQDT